MNNKILNFTNKSVTNQKEFIVNPNLDSDELNYIIENYIDKIDASILIIAIELHGHKISSSNIDNLIKLNNKEIMTAIAENYHISISINQMRDLTRLVQDDVMKQHPDYKEFWYATYVQKEEEFLKHTLHHIKNVNILAGEVLDFILENEDLKEYFNIPRSVNNKEIQKIVNQGMKLHDKAKTCSDENFLKENGLAEPLYKTLYSHYGKGLTPELKLVVSKLNSLDQKIVNEYLNEYDDWIKNLFFKIEKLADCIERGCNKVTPEEMKQDKIKPSKYLEKIMSPVELKIVQFFEDNYHNYCKEIF